MQKVKIQGCKALSTSF